ncbi:hypothetical protein [Trinickia symbiotica]|uniref:hypothetical protein n=1 Tax=Trinickia symbiotica TaxID=863227 RepID=UPI00215902D0|nr:hypothetical protein [Trinickia symbiotica]
MKRIALLGVALALSVTMAACAGSDEGGSASLGVEQIVAKNAAARGGADAWRKIDTMVWIGRVDTSNGGMPARFVLAMKRPNKTRFEIVSMNRMALRVFDGTHGWKLRPMRRGEEGSMQPYDAQELRFAHDEQVIDGPLIDHADKGIQVKLGGVDEIEGHKAYRLELRLPSGATPRVWVDASSFLEVKSEHESHTPLGSGSPVDVYYREYRTVEGVKLPVVIESGPASAPPADRLTIEKVEVNPMIDDKMFARPLVASPRNHSIELPPVGAVPALPGSAPGR